MREFTLTKDNTHTLPLSRLPLRAEWDLSLHGPHGTPGAAPHRGHTLTRIHTPTLPSPPPATQRPVRRNFSIGRKWRSDTSGWQQGSASDWSARGTVGGTPSQGKHGRGVWRRNESDLYLSSGRFLLNTNTNNIRLCLWRQICAYVWHSNIQGFFGEGASIVFLDTQSCFSCIRGC